MDLAKLFLQSMPWPVWIEDIDKRIIFLNKAYEQSYNISYKELEGKSNREAFPSNLDKLYDEQIKRCLDSLKLCVCRGKIDGKLGELHIFPIVDEEGNLKGVAGLVTDFNLERKKEIEFENQKNILRTIIDSLPEAIFYKDRNSRFIGCNKNFSDYYKNFGVDNVIGKTDLEIFPNSEMAGEFIKDDIEIMEGKKPRYIERPSLDGQGNKIIEESFKVPVINEDGEVWGIVGLARNITNQKTLEGKLRYLSYTDTLTGLYNRTYFEEKLEELNKEKFLPLGIIMGDVNGLKLVNDSLGHLIGDELLKGISNVLEESCSDKGFIFRWGGDEFMILVPNCNEYGCELVISNIKEKCKKNNFQLIELSIALGNMVKHTVEEDSYKCIKEVEERVYRQKLLEHNSVRSSMLNSFKKGLEVRNVETEEHAGRVEKYALEIGKRYGLKAFEMDELMIVANMHDIGKIAIDEDILLKQSPLTNEEFEKIKTHTDKGFRIINASSELSNVAKCVLMHHERWDGKGYPIGVSREEIPLISRIVAIADAYDVMTHDRIYKKAKSKKAAIKELKRCAGTQFDPKLIDLFLKYLQELKVESTELNVVN
ncbi:MAG: diguanylate cyclase [Peptostreptococcaceae bacterium]